MRYYYADAAGSVLGPLSADALQLLHARGGLHDSTPVIAEGGAAWGTYAQHVGARVAPAGVAVAQAPLTVGTYAPPAPTSAMPATTGAAAGPSADDVLRAQLNDQARRAQQAANAAGTALVTGLASTLRGVRTHGERAVLFGALAGLAALVLPWVHVGEEWVTGARLVKDVPKVWLFPVWMVACVAITWHNLVAAPAARALRMRWVLAIGAVWSVVTIGLLWFGSELLGLFWRFGNPFASTTAGLSVGAWLAGAGLIAITVGAFLQVGDGVRAPRSAP